MSQSTDNSGDARRQLVGEARRVVIKLGTNVLCRENGEPALARLYAIVEDVVDAHRAGKEIILVSSGAISLGMHRLGLQERPETLEAKQACAAIGQIRLMGVYEQAFERFGISAAQVLLSESDFSGRERYLNLRNTLQKLLQLRCIPIVNENDTVSTLEIETHVSSGEDHSVVFGDNDMLSALVASKLGAHLLVILSDVEGLYDQDPSTSDDAKLIGCVNSVTPEIEALAQGRSSRGRGGMRTKIQAAKVASHSGTTTIIARGSQSKVIRKVLSGDEVGTCFMPQKALSSRKRWIAFATAVSGRVQVNAGARSALVTRRASLLFAGVTALENDFKSGDIVSIVDDAGYELARGITNYSSAEAQKLVGRQSAEIQKGTSDKRRPEEFIHRDNIVVVTSEASDP